MKYGKWIFVDDSNQLEHDFISKLLINLLLENCLTNLYQYYNFSFSTILNSILSFEIVYLFTMSTTFAFLNAPAYTETMHLIQQICTENNIDESHGLPHAI